MDDVDDDDWREPATADGPPAPVEVPAPEVAYRNALGRYDGAFLDELARALGQNEPPAGRVALASWVAEHLAEPRAAERLLVAIPPGARLALTLLAVTESTTWPSEAMDNALGSLGADYAESIGALVAVGMLVVAAADGAEVRDAAAAMERSKAPGAGLVAHPAAVAAARTARPDGSALPRSGPVRQVREADGLEPILRLAVVWQRVADAPLRQTQQGTLYKRDRDRLEDDPVIAGPIADALEPLPDMPAFWLALARGVGLLESEPGSERLSAARPAFWSENAFHLPQMIAQRWLSLRVWHEQGGMQRDGATLELSLPYLRPVVLLWLAALEDDAWVTTDDLAACLAARSPRWDRATLTPATPPEPPPAAAARNRGAKPRVKGETTAGGGPEGGALDAILLGAAYQLGLVRTAEETATGRRAVQLTPLGRYLLALGPPPPPRPAYDHFLFVQPSFEVIAYRQGLTPSLVGQFSRFALWSQVGAALALRLTPESVYRGLEGGLTPQSVLDLLSRHSPRPLPPGVAEAVKTWAGRRERVTYHGSATLVEFATPDDLEQALRHWPEGTGPAPVRVSERLVLVEDERSIPFQRFRMTGARDYRRPPEVCVEVAPDGVTLSLDLARSDLLVDAELARLSDEQTGPSDRPGGSAPRRRFVVTAGTLARADDSGLTPALLGQWYQRRTGGDIPPAVRLLLVARSPHVPPLTTARPLVLHAPSGELMDGLAQHPATRGLLGERLGPTAAVIPEEALAPLRLALEGLGLPLDAPEPPAEQPRQKAR